MDKYKQSGVDIQKSTEFVKQIKKVNHQPNEFKNNIGWFAGGFDITKYNIKHPILFASTDGVGTKLLLAIENQQINYIGQDLVAMSVNDLICHGATPIFFLDYIGTNKIKQDEFIIIIKNIIQNLQAINCTLLGGETAEIKEMYRPNEYDLCGMAVGIVEKTKIIDPINIANQDIIIGINSTGFHSNGYSLIRNIIKKYKLDLNKKYFNNQKLIDCLLTPTQIYVNCILELTKTIFIHGAAHITGGGLNENINRILKKNQKAIININKIKIPEEFLFFQKQDQISDQEMTQIFNLGIGFCIIINSKNVTEALNIITKCGLLGYEIGTITNGNGVEFIWSK